MNEPAPLMTLQDVADRLQVSVGTMRTWRNQGKGPVGFKVGRHVRFRAADVEAWIESQVELVAAGR